MTSGAEPGIDGCCIAKQGCDSKSAQRGDERQASRTNHARKNSGSWWLLTGLLAASGVLAFFTANHVV